MDAVTLTQLVNQVAFPILVAIACGWYVKYITDANRTQIETMSQRHHEEMTNICTALGNNTLALQELTVYLKEVNK